MLDTFGTVSGTLAAGWLHRCSATWHVPWNCCHVTGWHVYVVLFACATIRHGGHSQRAQPRCSTAWLQRSRALQVLWERLQGAHQAAQSSGCDASAAKEAAAAAAAAAGTEAQRLQALLSRREDRVTELAAEASTLASQRLAAQTRRDAAEAAARVAEAAAASAEARSDKLQGLLVVAEEAAEAAAERLRGVETAAAEVPGLRQAAEEARGREAAAEGRCSALQHNLDAVSRTPQPAAECALASLQARSCADTLPAVRQWWQIYRDTVWLSGCVDRVAPTSAPSTHHAGNALMYNPLHELTTMHSVCISGNGQFDHSLGVLSDM